MNPKQKISRLACEVFAVWCVLIFSSSSPAQTTTPTTAPTTAERARALEPHLLNAGLKHGVNPSLLWTVCWLESRFQINARSPKGAVGVMQLMPATALRFGVRERLDPLQNIDGGARYLRYLLDFFGGNITLALAGYNAGEGNVLKYKRQVPPFAETRNYVRNGLLLLARMQNSTLYRNAETPPLILPTARLFKSSPSIKIRRSITVKDADTTTELDAREVFMLEVTALDALDDVASDDARQSLWSGDVVVGEQP